MSIIKSHDFTLWGNAGNRKIFLRPLNDEHLPFLYKWNSDPEVLYWSEGADVQENDAETVHIIYGKTSQTAYCFLIEADGVPVGECWLQKMNVKTVLEKYPGDADVRRIDMMIGDKNYWGAGIGTTIVGLLVDFTFTHEKVDYLHGLVFDYNQRSRRVFEKNGFTLFIREPSTQAPKKAKEDLYFRITKDDYFLR